MSYYVPQKEEWRAVSSQPDPPYVEVDAETATLHVVGGTEASVQLDGAPVDPSADTLHTVSTVPPSLQEGAPLCALYVRGQDLDVEDRRTAEAPSSHADVLDQLRSALDEILIPVYIDDAIEEVSEGNDDVFVLHTVQHDDGRGAPPTYFRVAIFRDGDLVLETEHGSL
ncbi:hypothetical protein [Salinibacter altiplanensis]|uniref:hypothetical protein n=1 Tax=Salinibacter altiplanensis TaxID=1803181 RepID=UPI000C9F4272|nr:hypothetical protein [Salinibacter altiplanensis]